MYMPSLMDIDVVINIAVDLVVFFSNSGNVFLGEM